MISNLYYVVGSSWHTFDVCTDCDMFIFWYTPANGIGDHDSDIELDNRLESTNVIGFMYDF